MDDPKIKSRKSDDMLYGQEIKNPYLIRILFG